MLPPRQNILEKNPEMIQKQKLRTLATYICYGPLPWRARMRNAVLGIGLKFAYMNKKMLKINNEDMVHYTREGCGSRHYHNRCIAEKKNNRVVGPVFTCINVVYVVSKFRLGCELRTVNREANPAFLE